MGCLKLHIENHTPLKIVGYKEAELKIVSFNKGVTSEKSVEKEQRGYLFGFNGKEMDNEVSGTGNQYDYGFRIYNPRLGKFLSVDPLSSEYPFYSTYHFAGNMPIKARDLDGREPDVVDGKLVGYFIMPTQGPTQIAEYINDPEVQKQYGYSLAQAITWDEITGAFPNHFQVTQAHRYHIDNIEYKNQQNTGHYLKFSDCEAPVYYTKPINPKMKIGTGVIDASGSILFGEVSASVTMYNMPQQTIYWNKGSLYKIEIAGGFNGAPLIEFLDLLETKSLRDLAGADVSVGAGNTILFTSDNPNVTKILGDGGVTVEAGYVTPFVFGGKISHTEADGFISNIFSVVAGSSGVIASMGGENLEIIEIWYDPSLRDFEDSVDIALEGEKTHPGSHFTKFLDENNVERPGVKVKTNE